MYDIGIIGGGTAGLDSSYLWTAVQEKGLW